MQNKETYPNNSTLVIGKAEKSILI
jgi:hypothetical protein